MRLVCPECHSNVTVPDDAAGKEATCPNCGKSFPTPSRYSAAVSELGAGVAAGVASATAPPGLIPPTPPASATAPAAPPGFVPPAAAPADGFLNAPAGAAVSAPAGYTKSCGLTISPTVVAWLPAALLTAMFLFTFFPWVGAYAGESAVYSQGGWGAAFKSQPSRNFSLEKAGLIPGGWLGKMRSDWDLLLPFFLFLFIALAFAWAERGLRATPPQNVPPLVKLWPWRNSIVAGAAALALLFLLWELARGFSMERAIQQHIAEKSAERRAEAAKNPNAAPVDPDTMKYEDEQAYRAYGVERTWWLYFALMCNVLAVGTVVVRVLLDERGSKHPPKLILHY